MYIVFTRMPGEVKIHLWWSLCTLYLRACQVRLGFTSGGVYVPCIYTQAR